MVLGKFMPPHRGHRFLIDFARHYTREVMVVVGSLAREPIPGDLRFRWVQQMFPELTVLHLTDEIPQQPFEHPDFWDIWRSSLLRILPCRPDYVFASEIYGLRLAEELKAEFVAVDIRREILPVSGTMIREDPLQYWDYLPVCVRPYFVRRVCIVGPESTGKSTLARRLAAHYGTVCVPEYARGLIDLQDGRCEAEDFHRIARGQLAAEDALAGQANRVLICDTDLMTTTLWAEIFTGQCPGWIRRVARERSYDLYLVTDTGVPYIKDPQRHHPERREWFRERCLAELAARGSHFQLIGGDWENRFLLACQAVDAMLARVSGRR
ncbi:MAG: AAA family ATPase [Acidobacteria bacterium]|nr:AAA family ATPase [Acidobacteriota bacterium]